MTTRRRELPVRRGGDFHQNQEIVVATRPVYGVLRETIGCVRALLLLGMSEDSILELLTIGDALPHRQLHVKIITSLLLTRAILRDDRRLLQSILAG